MQTAQLCGTFELIRIAKSRVLHNALIVVQFCNKVTFYFLENYLSK